MQFVIFPDFKQLDSSHAVATFPRSYLPYGLPCLDDLLGEEKHTDKFYCVPLHRQPTVSITKLCLLYWKLLVSKRVTIYLRVNVE